MGEYTAESEKNIDVSLTENNNDLFRLYMNEVTAYPLLSRDEESELLMKMAEGDEKARQKLINSNLRLVINIAKRFEGQGMNLMDLIQEGNIGLIKGVERYDSRKGAKLSTYATYWIRQTIIRALADKSRCIRVPAHIADELERIRKAQRGLSIELGHEPTASEIAGKLKMTESEIVHLLQMNSVPVSLDAPIHEDEDVSIGELIADEYVQSPEGQVEYQSMRDSIRQLVESLNEREGEIIKLRFGLDGVTPMTLAEVGNEFGITRERVRQLENKALRHLRVMISGEDHEVYAL